MEWDGEVEVLWKERHRTRVLGGPKPRAIMYTPEKTKKWEEYVSAVSLQQLRSIELEADEDFRLPITDCRAILKVRFNVRKPKSYPKSKIHATNRPDVDNLVKAVLDSVVNAKILEDDNCITDLITLKRYADEDHPIGIEIDLTCLPL